MTIKRVIYRVIILILHLGCSVSMAQNLGNYGQIFPVIEDDMRKHILHRLKEMEVSGELVAHQQAIEKRLNEGVIRPSPLNLKTSSAPKRFTIDPTQWVSHDITSPNGVLVAKAGTKLNPLQHVHFKKTLFFFDGDDGKQVAWAVSHYKAYEQVKFILTGGDIRKAANQFGRIYFDIGGRLTNTFHITHVPSVVYQEDCHWVIQEIGVNDV